MIGEFFSISVKNITQKGIRSWLTMIGIFIGIAAVVSLISLGQGLQEAINQQFEILGTNIIFIMPGNDLFSSFQSTSNAKLLDDDLEAVRKSRGVEIAGGMVMRSARITFHGENEYAFVTGLPEEEDAQDILLSGTGVTVTGKQTRFRQKDTHKAAIGYGYWNSDVFENPVEVGDTIKINGRDFEVIGLISKIGNPQDDSNIYIPYETSRDLFEITEREYNTIMARVRQGYVINETQENIEENLRDEREVEEGEEDFTVMTLADIQESFNSVLSAVNLFVIGIAMISLFVGGIGIMNTMYTSVLERTKEIGLMKAIGAKNGDIRMLFLIESGMIGSVGGAIGCALGSGLSLLVEKLASQSPQTENLKASITPELIFGALAFSFIVGCMSGVFPAIQASKLKPVEALRYE